MPGVGYLYYRTGDSYRLASFRAQRSLPKGTLPIPLISAGDTCAYRPCGHVGAGTKNGQVHRPPRGIEAGSKAVFSLECDAELAGIIRNSQVLLDRVVGGVAAAAAAAVSYAAPAAADDDDDDDDDDNHDDDDDGDNDATTITSAMLSQSPSSQTRPVL